MTRTLPAPQRAALTPGQLAMLRTMLEEQRTFRVDQLRQLHEPGSPLSSTDPEVVRSLTAGARAALHDVQAALWRMDEGCYGRCTGCGHPIEVHRLEILPASATCSTCRQHAESAPDPRR